MNKKNVGILTFLIAMLLAMSLVSAIPWTPTGNIDLKDYYNITNLSYIDSFSLNGDIIGADDINATEFWQNGYAVIDSNSASSLNVNSSTYWDGETSQANLNVNSSEYWDNLNSPLDITTLGTIVTGVWQGTAILDGFLSSLNASKLLTLSYLNNRITLDADNITNEHWIEDSQESSLNVNSSNYWDNYDTPSDFESSLNVNSSTYWDGETSQANLNVNSSTWWANLTYWSSTMFEAVANELSVKMSWFNSSVDARIGTKESDLNVNSSNYWDSLNTPSDINTGDITDDGTYITIANESNLNVNSSEYWDNLNSPSDITILGTIVTGVWRATAIGSDYIQNLTATKIYNEYWVNESGDTMSGDLAMGTNNLTGIGTFNPSVNSSFGKGIQVQSGEYYCLDGDTCSHFMYYNGTATIIE